MKLAQLTEAKKKLSKIDAGYEWVLRNGVFQNNGQDKKPKLLWEKYEKGKVKTLELMTSSDFKKILPTLD